MRSVSFVCVCLWVTARYVSNSYRETDFGELFSVDGRSFWDKENVVSIWE